MAPAIAYWTSRNRKNATVAALSAEDGERLRVVARATWRYFDTFVTEKDNWLPPDNFQEGPPQSVVAHRTSPTNIGLYLLSIVAANDFGWIGTDDAASRLEATFGTLQRMFRFRGHFYNWYDTTDLRALDPQYVSTVDSGNLAGHLIALANACEEPLPSGRRRILDGIEDTLALLRAASPAGAVGDIRERLDEFHADLRRLREAPGEPGENDLVRLEEAATELADALGRWGWGNRPGPGGEDGAMVWAQQLLGTVSSHLADRRVNPAELGARRMRIAALARDTAMKMDFRFLMDTQRMLMSIGYLASENRRDTNCYDLLASEARLASFFAIAKRDAPTKHWFRLGRPSTNVEGRPALASWSGSMFEYLMPSLVMRAPAGSLLERTARRITKRQIDYGRELGIPWGISESAFNARDAGFTYQYSNFGVPGLGLKRGLGSSTVIAPYATALAAMVDPVEAARNFAALAAAGGRGRFGYFEALDYTPARVPAGSKLAVVEAYMAHHQGMTVVAIADVLLAGNMRRRFHAEPIVAATELLLEESSPNFAPMVPIRAEEVHAAADVRSISASALRRFTTPNTLLPQVGILSNGRYSVMMTNSGSGYSRWNGVAVTRWRGDSTLDDFGTAVYLRDRRGPRVWSVGHQPTATRPETYTVDFAEDRVKLVRRDRTILTTLDVVVSPDYDAEVRRVSLTNMGGMDREVEVTSYAELALAGDADDAAHPAFSKMFVETEFVEDQKVLVATRRKRNPEQPEIWAAHFVVANENVFGELEYETDRARFIGVGRNLRSPAALDGGSLSNTVGTVLDPIFSLRRHVVVKPGATVSLSFWTVLGESREAVLAAARSNEDTASFERAATLAWTQAQVQLRHVGVDGVETSIFQRLAGCILFPEPALRGANEEFLRQNRFDIRALWAHGISGDLPIVLARFESTDDLALARELARAHEYLRLKGLVFDLVLLNDRGASYAQELQQSLEAIARANAMRSAVQQGGSGRFFVLRKDLLTAESEAALMAAVRVSLSGRRGSLQGQVDRLATGYREAPADPPPAVRPRPEALPAIESLEFYNGYGGFAGNGREYVVTIENGVRPPAPWINVVANREFGFHASADGAGYTWVGNSRDSQITPWSNDPVVNRSGEVVYLRDEETGAVWGPTAHPYCHPEGAYRARHGRGYSRFEHAAGGIAAEQTVFVPLDDSIKIIRLRLTNTTGLSRRLSVAAYAEWRLGPPSSRTPHTIVTAMSEAGVLSARDARVDPTGDRVAFLAFAGRPTAWTGDRAEFLGRHGSTAEPAGLLRKARLSGRTGPSLDPCGAILRELSIGPRESVEVVIYLGAAGSGRRRGRPHREIPDRRPRWAAGGDCIPLGRRPRHDHGGDAKPFPGHHAERLAALSDARLPDVGAERLLSGERRLRISRSAPGFAGACGCCPVAGPRADPAHRRPAVWRGRCPALVAAGDGAGRPHPHLRRSGLARIRRRDLCSRHRRLRGHGRNAPLSHRSGARRQRGGLVLHSRTDPRCGLLLSALRQGFGLPPFDRRPWPAPDRRRRLE